jgi:two-component system response regulator HydG
MKMSHLHFFDRHMARVVQDARRYAAVDAPILITGETGVGKDALARFIHAAGGRHRDPFVVIDCPALPATLLQSELFGHERGAFTDATRARSGRFEMAGRGTVYLDSVGGLAAAAQGALLRLLDERRVTRLGGTVSIDIPARIVASAGADIEAQVQQGVFRGELFHRLGVLLLHVPPLRERRADILPLARLFLVGLAARFGCPPPLLAGDAADALIRYRWPGNVRELRHTLERVLISEAGVIITAAMLPAGVLEDGEAYLAAAAGQRPTLVEVERRYIEVTLRHARGNQTRAAAILGISRKALWEKRKRYGMR